MIAYFDSSAFVALVLGEARSGAAARLWDEVDRVACARLLYVEARAALAQAYRQGRVAEDELSEMVQLVEALYRDVDCIEVDEPLVRQAGELAHALGLRGYDAVHLAAAVQVADRDFVFVSGDRALCAAARQVGLRVGEL